MEFDKYKEKGAYHWDEYNKKTPYQKHADKIKEWVRSGKTLDIGAGDGLITFLIGAIGIDDNEIAVRLAQDRDVNVSLGDAYHLEFENSSFNNVFMGDVIEHLEYPDIVMMEVSRVLNKNGYLYIVTPPAKKNGLFDSKYHYREYTPEQLIEYMGSFGFVLINDVEIINEYVRMYAVFQKVI